MRVALVMMVHLVVLELLDSRETVVSLDPQEPWDWLELPDTLDLRALWADLETVEKLVHLDRLAPLVPLEREEALAPLVPVVRRVWLERREIEA